MATKTQRIPILLALQGGGAMGAFSWGVADRLVRAPQLQIHGLSGTSAGAMNAVAMATGLVEGPDLARRNLARLWTTVGDVYERASGGQMSRWIAAGINANPFLRPYLQASQAWAQASRFLPFFSMVGAQGGRELARLVDGFHLPALRQAGAPRTVINTMSLRGHRQQYFYNETISAEALLGSAALPELMDPVLVEGRLKIDGAIGGSNPPIWELIRQSGPEVADLVLVQINPVGQHELPERIADLEQRARMIAFNGVLTTELLGVAETNRLILSGRLQPETGPGTRARLMRLHRIVLPAAFVDWSKLDASPPRLLKLYASGVQAADLFLKTHGRRLGQRSSYHPLRHLVHPSNRQRPPQPTPR